MTSADLGTLAREMLLVVCMLGGPLLLIGLLVGILVSILQALTQVHEATLAFVPKALAIGIALVLLGPFMMGTLNAYAQRIFDRIIAVGGS